MTHWAFHGIRGFRFVTPAFVLFVIGYLVPLPLVSQYIYTSIMQAEADAANVTLVPGPRLIPCSNQTHGPNYDIQVKAQAKASMILMGNSLCKSLPSMLMVLFWAPLSDKWGRKPIILISYAGALAQIIVDFFGIYFKLSPYFFYIGNAINGVSGGMQAFFAAASSYLTDVSSPKNRGLRIYIFEGCFFISIGLVMMAVGWWAKKTKSFAQPFYGAFAFIFVGLIYTAFIMRESRLAEDNESDEKNLNVNENENDDAGVDDDNDDDSEIDRGKNAEAFANKKSANDDKAAITSLVASHSYSSDPPPSSPTLSPFGRVVSAFRQEGDGKWNCRLILLLGVFFLSYTANMGGGDVVGLYEENAPFCWDSEKLGTIAMIKTFSTVFCSVLTLLVLRKLDLGDYPPIALCIVLSLTSQIIYAFARQDWHLYVGMVVNILSLTFPLLRTAVSKVCAKDKVGAAFAGVSFVNIAGSLVGSLAFSPLYAATVSFFPGSSFLFMALLEVFALCLLMPLMIKQLWRAEDSPANFEQF